MLVFNNKINNLDFRHHVAGDVSCPVAGLAPVEPVCVLLTVDLDQLPLPEGEFLVAGVRVRGHGGRVVVEQGDEYSDNRFGWGWNGFGG